MKINAIIPYTKKRIPIINWFTDNPYKSYILINSNLRSFALFRDKSKAFLNSILKNYKSGWIIVKSGMKKAINIPNSID